MVGRHGGEIQQSLPTPNSWAWRGPQLPRRMLSFLWEKQAAFTRLQKEQDGCTVVRLSMMSTI